MQRSRVRQLGSSALTDGFLMIRVASNRSATSDGPVIPADRPPVFPAIAEAWRELRKGFLDTYRPELHYMRGPGPKWLEKHDAHTRLDRARSSGRYDERACNSGLGNSVVSVIATRLQ
jgi:hypothetical protein